MASNADVFSGGMGESQFPETLVQITGVIFKHQASFSPVPQLQQVFNIQSIPLLHCNSKSGCFVLKGK
jgi:hypothetical protein